MSTQTREDFNSALKALEAANKAVSIPVWIPSLSATADFAVITTGQQKNLIRALVDNPVYQTNYIIALYDIIKTNCRNATLDVSRLPISDKAAIAIQLRQNSNGNTVVVRDDDIETTVELPAINFAGVPDEISNAVIEADGFRILCNIPTIGREAQLETENRSKIANSDIKSYDDIRNVLANAYVGELAKHIDVVMFGDSKIYLGSLNFTDAYGVIEKLPNSVVRQVITYMESVQKYLISLRTFKGTRKGAAADAPLVDTEITLDATFFTSK